MARRFLWLFTAVVLVATACGGDGGSEGVASITEDVEDTTAAADDGAAEVDTEQAMLDFTECMREQGVDMDDPTLSTGGGGFGMQFGGIPVGEDGEGDVDDADFEAMREAQEACSEYLENVTRDFEAQDMTEMQDQIYEYAECMRENGYDMGDPTFETPGGGSDGEQEPGAEGPGAGGPFGGMDPDDPDFQAAQEACQDIFGGFGPAGGGGGGGGPGAGTDE